MKKSKAKIGDWIVQPSDGGERVSGTDFDELILNGPSGCWFHMEQLDDLVWWMGVGEKMYYIHLNAQGKVTKVVDVNAREDR